MKLSKGSIWEFILGLFCILCSFNTEGFAGQAIFFVSGLAVCIHCVYLWKKQGDKNKNKDNDDEF